MQTVGLFKIILNISQNRTQKKAGESGLLAFTVGAPVRMYIGRAAARGRASARPRGHSTSTSTK